MSPADIRKLADDYSTSPYDRIRRTGNLLRALAEILEAAYEEPDDGPLYSAIGRVKEMHP